MAEVSYERDLWRSRGQLKYPPGRCLRGVTGGVFAVEQRGSV